VVQEGRYGVTIVLGFFGRCGVRGVFEDDPLSAADARDERLDDFGCHLVVAT